jgi:signal transduction histidine kinase
MEPFLSQIPHAGVLLLAVLAFNVLLLLFCITQSVRINRMRKSINRLLTGTSGANLEEGMHRLLDQVDEVKKLQNDQQFTLNRLSQRIGAQCGRVAIIRYNAFGDLGSDLSFSLAILDDAQNGVVITSIYGREESRVYAKPLTAGTSPYHMSEEEQAAIRKAMNPPAGA